MILSHKTRSVRFNRCVTSDEGKGGSVYDQTMFPVINMAKTGRCIEEQRRKAGLSVRELQSYFAFTTPQAIYKWQYGQCLPTVDNLLALSRVLGCKMEDLLVIEDQEVFHVLRDFKLQV